MNLRHVLRMLLMLICVVCWSSTIRAGVDRIEIKSRTDVLDGKSWGAVGPYERIVGTVFFAVDPKNPHNATIPNIDKAPRNAKGMVEYSSDIYIFAPKDQSKGNGVAFFEVPNRGGRGMFGRFSNAVGGAAGGAQANPAAEFGDGSLLNSGYTLVWVGWQFSLARNGNLIGIDLPIATDNGKPIEGRVVTPITAPMTGPTLALDPDAARYTPVDLKSADATLTEFIDIYDNPRTIPRDQWQFAKMVDGQVTPDSSSLYMKDGFQAGHIYQLAYTAKIPRWAAWDIRRSATSGPISASRAIW